MSVPGAEGGGAKFLSERLWVGRSPCGWGAAHVITAMLTCPAPPPWLLLFATQPAQRAARKCNPRRRSCLACPPPWPPPRPLPPPPPCNTLPCCATEPTLFPFLLQESNRSRTLYYTGLEVGTLLLVACVQVALVMKMFASGKIKISV